MQSELEINHAPQTSIKWVILRSWTKVLVDRMPPYFWTKKYRGKKSSYLWVYTVFVFVQSILKHDKNHYTALVFVGVAAEGLDQEEQALMAYNKAVQIDTSKELAWQVSLPVLLLLRSLLRLYAIYDL